MHEAAQRFGLIFIGGMAPTRKAELQVLLQDLHRYGAHHVNVQLGSDSMLKPEALDFALTLFGKAEQLGIAPAIESHRGTCTETPEKLYALADAYQQVTGRLLPISWDFSHFAVVKHLLPTNFTERLMVRSDLIQNAQQFHLRPFNGHHAQVPITRADGRFTKEVIEWLPFAEAVLRCWLEANAENGREIFVCPELGPIEGGYALSTFPSSWDDAKMLRLEIEKLWRRLVGDLI